MNTHGVQMKPKTAAQGEEVSPDCVTPRDAAPNRNPPEMTATSENSRCCCDSPGTNLHPSAFPRHPLIADAAATVAASSPSSSTKYLFPYLPLISCTTDLGTIGESACWSL